MKKIYFSFLLFFSFYNCSYEFNPAHLILNEESDFSYSVKLFYPQQYKYNSPKIFYPSNCNSSKVSKSSNIKNIIESYKLECAEDNEVIFFETSKGNFELELFGKDNPVTVSNFQKNITNKLYF